MTIDTLALLLRRVQTSASARCPWGHVINVPAKAVTAHVAHGDSATPVVGDSGAEGAFFTEEWRDGGPWDRLHEAAIRDELTINSQVDCAIYLTKV